MPSGVPRTSARLGTGHESAPSWMDPRAVTADQILKTFTPAFRSSNVTSENVAVRRTK